MLLDKPGQLLPLYKQTGQAIVVSEKPISNPPHSKCSSGLEHQRMQHDPHESLHFSPCIAYMRCVLAMR